MKTILSPLEMKNVDRFAIERLRIPSLRLMEWAGTAVVKEIVARSPVNDKTKPSVVLFCGKGNNGGDGFVVARQLAELKYRVTVVLIEKAAGIQGDARENYEQLQDYKIAELVILGYPAFQRLKKKKYDVIVDAMLGTSFTGKLNGKYLSAVRWSNKQKSLRIAVDIPTGLNGETGEVRSDAFRAAVTVSMSNPKSGFYFGRAKEYTGDVVIADIGIPRAALPTGTASVIEKSDVHASFPRRAVNSHKHSVGKIFILAGSKGMMGAAFLCSQAAMRSGAGQVILGIPESEYDAVARRTVEVMPLGLPSTREGSISAAAAGEIEQRIDWADVLLIGCGMSRNSETQHLIREIIAGCRKPVIIDADGLQALVGNLSILPRRNSNIILTPHHGEFSRLSGIPAEEIAKRSFQVASKFAKKNNVTLVLKGAPTVTATTKEKLYVNPNGNPGMSTAGSGDVLAGIIASLVGQGNNTLKAAVNGVFLHGAAGDRASAKFGINGMIASDMIDMLPSTIKDVVRK